MKHIFDLNKMGLEPTTEMENQNMNGGGMVTWFIQQLILNWDDVKKGISDGWNGQPPSK
jgi:hypothetical protein